MKKLAVMAVVAAALSANVQAFDVATKYQQSCGICHATALAGAPKSFDKAAWEPRLALGMDALLATINTGKGAMPPKGMCMDCTPEQYKQLIEYMATPK